MVRTSDSNRVEGGWLSALVSIAAKVLARIPCQGAGLQHFFLMGDVVNISEIHTMRTSQPVIKKI